MRLTLHGGEVHLWVFLRDAGALAAHAADGLLELLSSSERARVTSVADPKARRQLVMNRVLLRSVLACYLDASPAGLVLVNGSNGKPRLDAELAGMDLQFNLSHTSSWVLLGCTLGAPLGVDVEEVREGRDVLGLSRRYFSTPEVESLAALPAAQLSAAFFRVWTAKEALLKADGHGLEVPWQAVATELRASKAVAGMQLPGCVSMPESLPLPEFHHPELGASSAWNCLQFRVGSNHVACVAVRHPSPTYGFPQLHAQWRHGVERTDFRAEHWLEIILQRT